eukprot:TRINITY_DN807_c1_g3_i1.p1 TRINITY_DN807_c1_g3~~TRINITY_DN807_c1_g3_i1.p1  ORF type:complete len:1259 (-),score=636.42 TRINITY_DN807_c1_g3_i1:182-3856(-)
MHSVSHSRNRTLTALALAAAVLCAVGSVPGASALRVVSPASLAAILPNGGIPDSQTALITGMPVAPEVPVRTLAVFQTPFLPESCTATNDPATVAGNVFFMWGVPGPGTPGCTTKQKILLAESLGASALALIYVSPTIPVGLTMYTFPDPFLENKIPSYVVRFEHGFMIKSFVDKGIPVEIDLFQSRVPADEVANLRDFYNQGNGKNWVYLIPGVMSRTWNLFDAGPELPAGVDPARDKWPLVSFTPDGRVMQTGFLSVPMGGPFPPALLKMTRLIFIALSGAGFTGDFPDLSAMKRLNYINLKDSLLTGTIPASMADLKELLICDLANNRLSGTLPSSVLAGWTKIATIDFSGSDLSGSLPPFSQWATKLTSLNLNGNRFSGSIPSDIGTASPGLALIDFTGNELSGPIPDLSGLTMLSALRLRGNKLSGPFPPSMAALTKLTAVDLADNQLSGPLTVDLTPLTGVTQVFLQGNNFEGAVPTLLPASTTFLDLSRNKFTILPKLTGLTQLKRISIADNQIVADITTVIRTLLPTSPIATAGLEEIDISGNRFHSNSTEPFTTLFEGPFASLRSFRAARNDFLGGLLISGSANDYSILEEMDFSNNPGLTGPLPETISAYPVLKSFDIRGTRMMHRAPAGDPDQLVPSFITPSFALSSYDAKLNWWCPELLGNAGNTMHVLHDPLFHNGKLCQCDKGFHRVSNGTCLECPVLSTTCPGFANDTVIRFRAGYYPSPPEDPIYAIRCFDDALSGTSCNPNTEDVFTCKSGFEGRLCSRCADNHFERNRQCVECNPLGALIVTCAAVIIIATVVFVLWRVGAIGHLKMSRAVELDKTNWTFDAKGSKIDMHTAIGCDPADLNFVPQGHVPHTSVSFLTLFTIFINYLQTTSIALDGLQLGSELSIIKSLYELASFSLGEMGLECITTELSYSERYQITWLFPVAVVVLVWILTLVVMAIRKALKKDTGNMPQYALGLCLLLVNFAYFPFAKISLAKYRCEMDPGLQQEFLADAPYVPCDAIDAVGKLIPVLLYVVLGMTLLASFSFYGGLGKHLLSSGYFRTFGWFYIGFKPHFWYFPLLLTQRKLLLALVTGLADQDDVFRYTSVIGVLAGAMFAIIYFKPYKFTYANRLDAFATFAGLIIYGNSLIISNPDITKHDNILVAITFTFHILALMIFFGAFINWARIRVANARRRTAYAHKVLPMGSIKDTELNKLTQKRSADVDSNP